MNKLWKIGLVVLLLIGLLSVLGGCTLLGGTTTTPADGEAQSGWGSTWPMLLFLVVIFAFFWFVMVRPQRKRQKEHQQMMEGLNKGDKVITAGGIYGTIDSLSEDTVTIKVEGGTTLRVARGSIAVIQEK